MLRKFVPAALAVLLILIGVSSAIAHGRPGHMQRGAMQRGPGVGHVGGIVAELDLTDEQRLELAQTVFDMREADATKDEIWDAVLVLFDDFGIEVPEEFGDGPIRGLHVMGILGDLLTDEQREEIHETVQALRETMKDEEATREEIHDATRAAVQALLIEWGLLVDGDDVAAAAADLAVVDAEIQAAPSVTSTYLRMNTSWAAVKLGR